LTLLTVLTGKKIMGKTACKDKKYEPPKEPRFICKKCGVTARKEKEICKPQKI
jgi:hypothetical protein